MTICSYVKKGDCDHLRRQIARLAPRGLPQCSRSGVRAFRCLTLYGRKASFPGSDPQVAPKFKGKRPQPSRHCVRNWFPEQAPRNQGVQWLQARSGRSIGAGANRPDRSWLGGRRQTLVIVNWRLPDANSSWRAHQWNRPPDRNRVPEEPGISPSAVLERALLPPVHGDSCANSNRPFNRSANIS